MLIKNTSLYFVGELISRGGKLISLYLIANLVSKSDFGYYSYLISLCLIILIFFDFGMNTLVMLRTSWKRFEHLLPFFFAGKVIAVSSVCGALAAYDLLFGLFDAPGLIAPFLLLCIGWDATAFFGNALRTRLNFARELALKLIANIGFLGLLTAAHFLYEGMTATSALWFQAIAFLPACILGFAWTKQGVKQTTPARRHLWRGLLALGSTGAPMTLASSAGVLQPSIDSIVLGASAHMEANASFTLVNRLGQLAQMPINALIYSALPYMVEALRGSRSPDKKMLHIVIATLVGLAAVTAQLFVLVTEWGIPLLLGSHYSDVRYFAPWLGLYIIPIFVYPLYVSLLSAMRHVISAQIILGLGTIFNLALDVVVINLYGPYAIAWVAGAMHWVLLAMFILYYRARIGYWPISKIGAAYALISGISVLLPTFFFPAAHLGEIVLRGAFAFVAMAASLALLLKHRILVKGLLSRQIRAS